MNPITIATRQSALALWQAEYVKRSLEQCHSGLSVSLLRQDTQGDRIQDRTLAAIGGKGLFIKELEERILEGSADVAVHSLKDVPMTLPDGFELAAILERHSPFDAFIVRDGKSLADLADDAVIGTCSLRRQCQLKRNHPNWVMVDLRGNIDTRLKKLDGGEMDAIVLAESGLDRMGWSHRVTEALLPDQCCPAAGQGALALEIRAGDERLRELLAPLHHESTAQCVRAEREMSRLLGGSCQVPLGAYACWEGDQIRLQGFVGRPDGSLVFNTTQIGTDPLALGRQGAEDLMAQGAGQVLDELGVSYL